jgi:hypothetical protein
MRRRDFITFLVAAAWPFATRAQQPDRMPNLGPLERVKRDYEKISHPNEAARSNYITRLVRLREKAARAKTDEWQAIDAEIKRHPAPSDADSAISSSLLVGQWESPRHDYLFRADGTWTMLPEEEHVTHGRWRIEGNQYFLTSAMEPPETSPYTIILITKNDLVFTDQTAVFYEERLK